MPSKKKWRWRGFFCRGTWSLRNAHITAQGFTQVQDYLFIQQSWPKQCDPEYDFCLEGLETYDSAEYEASRIGIMGWLLSCRQA
jgi:hypothetical protein